MALRRATVVAVEPDSVEVRLAPGCGACSGCAGACSAVRSNWRLPLRNARHDDASDAGDSALRPGSIITVHIREQALRRIAMRVYGAWLLGLIAGALAGMTFGALVLGTGEPHDFSVLVFAAAGTCAGFAWSQRTLRAMARRGEYLTFELAEKSS